MRLDVRDWYCWNWANYNSTYNSARRVTTYIRGSCSAIVTNSSQTDHTQVTHTRYNLKSLDVPKPLNFIILCQKGKNEPELYGFLVWTWSLISWEQKTTIVNFTKVCIESQTFAVLPIYSRKVTRSDQISPKTSSMSLSMINTNNILHI